MPKCEFCNSEATTTRRIYDEVMQCTREADVCEDCDNAITDGVIG